MSTKNINTERQWFTCPICGQKLCQFCDTAVSIKVFLKCKKCHNDIELRINTASGTEDDKANSSTAHNIPLTIEYHNREVNINPQGKNANESQSH